ncbi:hypothetical protein DXG01_009634 [Tephrocybe rancida]|nr:hypothetical protein DXG01_009634 [Tephrocybe rancida]
MVLLDDICALVTNISTLSVTLPASVPLGTKEDKMYRVLNLEEGETPYATFNRRFDLLFKEDKDCRDEAGRLRYLRRGPFGVVKLCAYYLSSVDWTDADLPLELVKLKLNRVNDELVYLISNAGEEDLVVEPQVSKPRFTLKPPKSTPISVSSSERLATLDFEQGAIASLKWLVGPTAVHLD